MSLMRKFVQTHDRRRSSDPQPARQLIRQRHGGNTSEQHAGVQSKPSRDLQAVEVSLTVLKTVAKGPLLLTALNRLRPTWSPSAL